MWADRLFDRAVLARVAAVTVPALAAFLTLRFTLPTVGREQVPGYGSLLGGRIDVIQEAFQDARAQLVAGSATVYGPLWLIAPLGFVRFDFARRGLVLVGLCLVAFTFALDWGRIIAVAAPVVYAAAAWVLWRHPRTRAPIFALCAVLVVGYATYMQVEGVQNLIDAGPPPYPVR